MTSRLNGHDVTKATGTAGTVGMVSAGNVGGVWTGDDRKEGGTGQRTRGAGPLRDTGAESAAGGHVDL